MDYLAAFNELREHAWLKRNFKVLKKADIDYCERFIAEHQHLDVHGFIKAVNRMWIDKPEKPKTWAYIMETLSCAGTRAHVNKYGKLPGDK